MLMDCAAMENTIDECLTRKGARSGLYECGPLARPIAICPSAFAKYAGRSLRLTTIRIAAAYCTITETDAVCDAIPVALPVTVTV
jgi:hypothetical protein